MEDVSNRIAELIKSLSLTNKDFAESIDVAPAIISHVLSGRNKASLHLIQQITTVYTNVNLAYLLHGQGSLFTKNESRPEPAETSSSNLPSGARYVAPPSGAPLPKKESPAKEIAPVAKSPGPDEEGLTNVYTNVNRSKTKTIERIVIFYADKSFEEYRP